MATNYFDFAANLMRDEVSIPLFSGLPADAEAAHINGSGAW